MRVGIDATWAAVAGTGTASYTEGLVRALTRHREHDFVLYFQSGDDGVNPLYELVGPNVSHRVVDGWGQPGRTLVSLSRAISSDHIDVFHSPGYFLPFCRAARVATFHDVNMLLQWKKWWRPGMRLGWLSLTAQTLVASRVASCIVADSHHAARSIRSVLRLPGDRIRVVYPGIDDRYFAEARDESNMEERYGLSEYLLYVGVLSPQKNLEGIVRVFAQLDRPTLKLAIAGRVDGPYFEQVVRPLVRSLGISSRVGVLGVVPPGDMVALYRGATAFLFPSFAEGFGLGPLEAMACGTPVVASNVSCLPEILGSAAILVDPHDVTALAAATEAVLSDSSVRSALIERGRGRARLYRWSASAARALQVYADVT